MKNILLYLSIIITLFFTSCHVNLDFKIGKNDEKKSHKNEDSKSNLINNDKEFKFFADSFADLKVIRYKVPGFEDLSLNDKKLIYYLSQASLSGRDIIFDQNYRYNLFVRKTLEAIIAGYTGDRKSEDFQYFVDYTKRVWFSGGIHHHYSGKKIEPTFSRKYLMELIENTITDVDYPFPFDIRGTKSREDRALLMKVIFDNNYDVKRVNKDAGADLIFDSANNYYGENVTQKESEKFYNNLKLDPNEKNPIEYGLNSRLEKDENGNLFENVYKVDGLYGEAISKMIYWIDKAKTVAQNEEQKKCFELLIKYYKTGDLKIWDEYCVQWVKTKTDIDWINGFVEVYGDAVGRKGAYESIVQIKDLEASKTTEVINEYVQWFEDNSSIMDEHKKENVVGVSYKVVNVGMESGDASPSSPIGVNLPNNGWIREQEGSKSVSLGNLIAADGAASGSGFLEEFCFTIEEIQRAKKYGDTADKLGTLLHEVVGHASGKINEGVGTPKETLKNYKSTLEEARADLVALYYIMNPKLVEIGLMESLECGKAEYDSYIRNGLMLQLRRIEPGEVIEQDHMRNRQLVASWAYEKGKDNNIIEKIIRKTDNEIEDENGDISYYKTSQTYFVINDYEKLQDIFGQLLREIQRITSEGDFEAGKNLVENYGVQVNQEIHQEVLQRSAQFNSAPYRGFLNPEYKLVIKNDEIVNVLIQHNEEFTDQMMRYAKDYSFLTIKN